MSFDSLTGVRTSMGDRTDIMPPKKPDSKIPTSKQEPTLSVRFPARCCSSRKQAVTRKRHFSFAALRGIFPPGLRIYTILNFHSLERQSWQAE